MIVNNSSVLGNHNATHSSSSSSAGLAAGLTLFFLLLLIVIGVVAYKYHNKIRSMLHVRHRRSQKKEEYKETPEADSHQYTSREQSMRQTPIYENLTTRTTQYDRCAENQSRSHGEPEEDLYLQCDSPHDAIYSNDPVCNLSVLSDYQEEDVYIMPDS